MKIRTATQSDIYNLARLWREQLVIRNQTSGIPFEDTEEWQIVWIDRITEQMALAEYVFYVAENEAVVTGFIAGHTDDKTGYVDAIALDAHRYYGGQGKLLYATLRDWFNEQSVNTVLVSVPRYHAVEQAFWRSLGATEWKDEACPPRMMTMTL